MTTRTKQLTLKYIASSSDDEDAYIVGYDVPVWAIIGYLEAARGDVAQVAADYELPVDAVAAALAYYRKHRAQIDARIAANAALDQHIQLPVSHAA